MISGVIVRYSTPTVADTIGVTSSGIPTINGKTINLDTDTNIINYNGRLMVFDGDSWVNAIEFVDYIPTTCNVSIPSIYKFIKMSKGEK